MSYQVKQASLPPPTYGKKNTASATPSQAQSAPSVCTPSVCATPDSSLCMTPSQSQYGSSGCQCGSHGKSQQWQRASMSHDSSKTPQQPYSQCSSPMVCATPCSSVCFSQGQGQGQCQGQGQGQRPPVFRDQYGAICVLPQQLQTVTVCQDPCGNISVIPQKREPGKNGSTSVCGSCGTCSTDSRDDCDSIRSWSTKGENFSDTASSDQGYMTPHHSINMGRSTVKKN